MQKKFSLKHNRLARTIVISGGILVVLIFAILRYQGALDMLGTLLHIMRPIIIGGVLAFALNRPLNFFQLNFRKLFAKMKLSKRHKKRKKLKLDKLKKICKKPNEEHTVTTGRAPFVLACITTYLITLAVVTGIAVFVIPQLYDSVVLFGKNLNGYIANIRELISNSKINFQNVLGDSFDLGSLIEKFATKLNDIIANATEHIPALLQTAVGVTSDVIGGVVDVFLGIVFSIYILVDKENLKRNTGRLTRLIIRGERYSKFEKVSKMAFTTFSNFITGQIIEACIVGVMCFVGMSVIGFDYAVLISVIVGVTNLIPIVGPIIGTVPGAFILLLIDPLDAVWFVVFIIVIQQTDCNIIYPRIVGTKVGLPSFWVMVAITIGGGVGGVIGMILGVPILSIVYALVSEWLHEAEEKEQGKEQAGQQ